MRKLKRKFNRLEDSKGFRVALAHVIRAIDAPGIWANTVLAQEKNWIQSSVRGKPISNADDWDGDQAVEDILSEYRNEDGTVNSTEARKWFGYFDDASNGNNQEDYKMPMAREVNGELKVTEGGIKANRQFNPEVEGVSDAARQEHASVIEHYERRLNIEPEDQ